MKKESQIAGYWPQIYQKLKAPPQGINLGSFPSKMPTVDKISFDNAPPGDSPNAIAYVTTGDADQNGKLDSMHVVIPNLEKAFREAGIGFGSPSDFSDMQNLYRILSAFVEVISHEVGHIDDFNPNAENPFPGGEPAAESAAQRAVQQTSFRTASEDTNIEDTHELRSNSMKTKLEELVSIANELDGKHPDVADMIDSVITKMSQDLPDEARTSVMYHPTGEMGHGAVSTSDVDFSYGSYNGSFGPERYFIMQGEGRLGDVQFPNDPFTYKDLGEGRFLVVSGPESKRSSIGKTFTKSAPKSEPTTPKPEVIGRPLAPEYAGADSLEADVEMATTKYSQQLGQFAQLLRSKGIEGSIVDKLSAPTMGPKEIFNTLRDYLDRAAAEGDSPVNSSDREELHKELIVLSNNYKKMKEMENRLLMKSSFQVSQMLSKLASDLDGVGNHKYADQVDDILNKIAEAEVFDDSELKSMLEELEAEEELGEDAFDTGAEMISEDVPVIEEPAPEGTEFEVVTQGPFGRD